MGSKPRRLIRTISAKSAFRQINVADAPSKDLRREAGKRGGGGVHCRGQEGSRGAQGGKPADAYPLGVSRQPVSTGGGTELSKTALWLFLLRTCVSGHRRVFVQCMDAAFVLLLFLHVPPNGISD